MHRELYPWTPELCAEARKQHRIAKANFDSLPQTHFDNSWLLRVSQSQASIAVMAGFIIEGMAASSAGNNHNSSLREDYGWKQPDMHLGEMLLWVK